MIRIPARRVSQGFTTDHVVVGSGGRGGVRIVVRRPHFHVSSINGNQSIFSFV